MPTLPSYNLPQVSAQPAQGGLLNLQATNLGGALGEGLARFGQQVQEAQFHADQMVSENLSTKFKEYQVQRLGKLFSLKGEDAIKPSEDTGLTPSQQALQDLKDYQRTLQQDIGKGAKKLFTFKTDPYLLHFQEQAQNHEAREVDTYNENTLIGKRDVSTQAAALDPQYEMKTGTSLNDVHDAAALEAQRRGLSGDAAKGFTLQFTSPVVSATLDGLVQQGAAPQAKLYLEANKGLMTAKDYERAEQQTTKGLDVGAGMDAADRTIMAKQKPDGSFSLEEVLTDLRAQRQKGTISTEVYQHAEQEAKDRFSVHRVQVDSTNYANKDSVWGTFNKTRSLSAVQLNPAFSALPQKEQDDTLQDMKNRLKQNLSDPGVVTAQRVAYWDLVNRPDFLQLSDSAIRSMQGKLGPTMTVEAMDLKNKMAASPIKVQQVKIDNDQVTSELRSAGLLPVDGKMNDEQKNMVADITYQLKQAQQASGVEWSLDNTKKLLHPLIQQVVTDKHWWGGTETTPVYKLRMQNVKIPDAFAADMEATNQQQWMATHQGSLEGYQPLTLPQLYQTYYNAKQKGIIDDKGNYKPKMSLTPTPAMMRSH